MGEDMLSLYTDLWLSSTDLTRTLLLLYTKPARLIYNLHTMGPLTCLKLTIIRVWVMIKKTLNQNEGFNRLRNNKVLKIINHMLERFDLNIASILYFKTRICLTVYFFLASDRKGQTF